MFGWFRRKPAAPKPLLSAAGTPAVVPPLLVRAPVAAAARTLAITGAACRRVVPKEFKQPSPAVGMPALEVSTAKATPMQIVAVKANGRTVLAKAIGVSRVAAFTRRADKSYRLAGAPDGGVAQLVIGLDGHGGA